MARAQINLPTRFLDALDATATQLDAMAEEALTAGASVVEPRLRANLQASIGQGTKEESRSTGQLVAALGTTTVKVNSAGAHNVKVGFAENRLDGKSNALIASVLEYGRSTQPARPFLAPTRSQSSRGALAAMKRVLTTRIGGMKP